MLKNNPLFRTKNNYDYRRMDKFIFRVAAIKLEQCQILT